MRRQGPLDPSHGECAIRRWTTLAADFPGLPVLNRGFGGSTLYEVNHYAPRIVLPYRPRLIVVYAGDNEIAMGRSATDVARDYRHFVSIVRAALPSTHIAFVSVKPSGSVETRSRSYWIQASSNSIRRRSVAFMRK